jgi:hypothetical protein
VLPKGFHHIRHYGLLANNAFAPLQDPGRTDDPSPMAVSPMLPPLE